MFDRHLRDCISPRAPQKNTRGTGGTLQEHTRSGLPRTATAFSHTGNRRAACGAGGQELRQIHRRDGSDAQPIVLSRRRELHVGGPGGDFVRQSRRDGSDGWTLVEPAPCRPLARAGSRATQLRSGNHGLFHRRRQRTLQISARRNLAQGRGDLASQLNVPKNIGKKLSKGSRQACLLNSKFEYRNPKQISKFRSTENSKLRSESRLFG